MAMGKAVVSTSIGAEGIHASDGREILIADDSAGFAAAAERLLDDEPLARGLGQAGRALVTARYSWTSASDELDRFLAAVVASEAREGERVPAARGR
jgi:glycosyltransferase involved in cell wall biosynthesis